MNLPRLMAQVQEPIKEGAAAAGAAISIGGTGWAWLGHANDILQFVVLVISAATGIASYRYYTKKRHELRREE